MSKPEKSTWLKVKLSRVAGGEALRTSEVIGTTNRLPEVGQQLVMVGEPLEKGAGSRWVNTSKVVSYTDVEAGRLIVTKSGSQYFIEILEETK